MREILLEIVADLEDLRANLVVLAANAAHPRSIADASDARAIAILEVRKSYEALRKKIGALS
ncbi:MAG: hypothetical protein ABSD88_18385 [Candidatus Korobacteraceae bacterium]|jgi:aspartate/glutamate racemase